MQQAVEIVSKGKTLRGMVNKPDNIIEKVPTVMILHGFAGNKMGPHFIFVKLSRLFERIGIASVRFDFAGTGESDGEFSDMTISGELSDAENILQYIKTLDFVDTKNIAIIGFSMGGAIASMLASKYKKDIHSLCLWAPAGNIGQLVLKDWIGNNYPNFKENASYDFEGDVMGTAFIKEVSKLDIYDKAKEFDKNVLIIHGDADNVVPLRASLKYIDLYGYKANLSLVTGANHVFDKKEWQEEMLEKTIGFLKEEFALKISPAT